MRVTVACPNGHRFKCDERHLHQRTKCPREGCGVEFRLEMVGDASPGTSSAGVSRTRDVMCSNCGNALAESVTFCAECWTDLTTGEKLPFETPQDPARASTAPVSPSDASTAPRQTGSRSDHHTADTTAPTTRREEEKPANPAGRQLKARTTKGKTALLTVDLLAVSLALAAALLLPVVGRDPGVMLSQRLFYGFTFVGIWFGHSRRQIGASILAGIEGEGVSQTDVRSIHKEVQEEMREQASANFRLAWLMIKWIIIPMIVLIVLGALIAFIYFSVTD